MPLGSRYWRNPRGRLPSGDNYLLARLHSLALRNLCNLEREGKDPVAMKSESPLHLRLLDSGFHLQNLPTQDMSRLSPELFWTRGGNRRRGEAS